MLKLSNSSIVTEIAPKTSQNQYKVDPKSVRPDVVDAKVYKLKSAFVNKSVFITLSYMQDEGRKRPIEIFINSKDFIGK